MLDMAVVGALTSMLVQIGKKHAPQRFTSDANVAWTVAIFATLNVLSVIVFDGGYEWRVALSEGIVEGLALAGLYRGISSASKNRSVDMTEQVVPLQITPANEDDEKEAIGFR